MKLLIICPQPLDGTAYWRATSPFSRLRRQAGDGFDFTITAAADYRAILEHDALMLQRPCSTNHVHAARAARLLGRPVWCDWDDHILGVPDNNKRAIVYGQEAVKDNVVTLAAGADVVTVTNNELAKVFAEHSANAPIVVPNALDPTLKLGPADEDRLPVRRVAWRGGDSHNEDLMVFGGAFPRAARENEGSIVWHFVGQNPHWLLGEFPAESCRVHDWMGDVAGYLRFMAKLRPAFLAVPLVDTKFNRCKSSIAVLEAAWMGAVPIVPAWLEGCDLPGTILYDEPRGFDVALRGACRMPEAERIERLAKLREAIASSIYALDKANLLRALILKRLFEMHEEPKSEGSSVKSEGSSEEPVE